MYRSNSFVRAFRVARLLSIAVLGLVAAARATQAAAATRVNFLFITADDMNYDTPGFTGSSVPDITPNLDRLAREGMRFINAHVTVAVCQPSRECLMTGRYPHRNGATGFYPVRNDVTTLAETLHAAGYSLGILGKVTHLQPKAKFPWDYQHDQPELGSGRDPALYYRYASEFLSRARAAGRPFFLMANSHDPHRPFAGSETEKRVRETGGKKRKARAEASDNDGVVSSRYPAPGRTYRPDEITVPGFLPDIPAIRTELAEYFSSAHRCDETVGAILRALHDAGLDDSTMVVFLSDNGISMPFAKSNCYLTSTRTPWLVRWPGQVKPGTVDGQHFISGIDFMPTVLDVAGLAAPEGMDGRSILPLLRGGDQPDRARVFTCYNDTSGARSYPMRCLQDRRFGYIFNAWSDGTTRYASEPLGGMAFAAMKEAAPTNPAIDARVQFLWHRVPEELYDFAADPSALHNLAADPAFQGQLREMRSRMLAWMAETQDPLLERLRAATANPAARAK